MKSPNISVGIKKNPNFVIENLCLEEVLSKYVSCVCSPVYQRMNTEMCNFFSIMVQAVFARVEQSGETR